MKTYDASEFRKPQYSEGEMYCVLMVGEWIQGKYDLMLKVAMDHVTKEIGNSNAAHGIGGVNIRRAAESMAPKMMGDMYPYLEHVREQEGVYGHRRIAIELGVTIERAFDMFSGEEQEILLHGDFRPVTGRIKTPRWAGVGCYDFDLVPACCDHAMELQRSARTLGLEKEVKVSTAQMYEFMWALFPSNSRPNKQVTSA